MFEAKIKLIAGNEDRGEVSINSMDFEEFCTKFMSCIENGPDEFTGDNVLSALVAEDRARPADRVRRYKGYSGIYGSTEATAENVRFRDFCYSISDNKDILCTIVDGSDGAKPVVIRYGLSRDSCFLVCAQNVLTADLATKVISESIFYDRGSADWHISFDVQAAFNAISGAKFVAGHSGFDGEFHHLKIVIADQFYPYMLKCLGHLG